MDLSCFALIVCFGIGIVTRMGKVLLHKAKRNTNMSFSKGKTWNLEDLRQVEVIEVREAISLIADGL